MIINHGYERDSTLLKQSEVDLDMAEDHYIAGNANSESSIGGIYAAGDISCMMGS